MPGKKKKKPLFPPDASALPKKKTKSNIGAKLKQGMYPPGIRAMIKSANAPLYGGMLNETTVTAKAPSQEEKYVAKEFSKELNRFADDWPRDKVYLGVNLYTARERVEKRAKDVRPRMNIFDADRAGRKIVKDTKKRVKRLQKFRYGK